MKHKMHQLTVNPIMYRTIVLDYKTANDGNAMLKLTTLRTEKYFSRQSHEKLTPHTKYNNTMLSHHCFTVMN
jgi:hypothetical protein